MIKITPAQRRQLLRITSLPTAAGREGAVVAEIDRWIAARAARLTVRRDDGGNILIMQREFRKSRRPLLITAHLDHPAFVVRRVVDARELELEFRGGVHEPYFKRASIEVIDDGGRRHAATVVERVKSKHVFPVYAARLRGSAARLKRGAATLRPGDIARWQLPKSRIRGGLLHTNACDDLAAVAAALAVMERLLKSRRAAHVGLLFTRAEEVGFIGALHSIRSRLVPRRARLLCLENSRSFPSDSPIGGGAILRVGDRASVFSPRLTNALSVIFAEAKKADSKFLYQRKLMPGGACEATAFAAHGFESTCLCLPLGNYHNMCDIDGVLKGKSRARVGQEIISLGDFASLITMLELAAAKLKDSDEGTGISLKALAALHRSRKFVLAPGPARVRR